MEAPTCKMEWASFLQDREIVPQTQLYANILPAVSITSPANNAIFSAPATITINASASDNVSVAKVDFYNGTILLGSDNAAPFNYAWTGVAKGAYVITAIATDNLGGVTVSQAVSLIVNVATGIDETFILTHDAIVIAPNPVEHTLTILTSLDLSDSYITIADITGRELIKSAGDASVDVTSLHAGIYIITIITSENGKFVKRFVKK